MIGTVRSTFRSVRAQRYRASQSLSFLGGSCVSAVDSLPMVRFGSTSKGSEGDSGGMHALFEQQMMELENERKAVFGEETAETSAAGAHEEPFDQYTNGKSMQDEVTQIHDERAALFAFTDEEKKVWGAAGGDDPHTHSAEFMRTIHAAREAHFDVGNGEEEEGEAFHPKSEGSTLDQHTEFTHLTAKGDSVSMVDVGSKAVTRRVAKARSVVVFPPAVMTAFGLDGGKKEELVGPKGPIFATAKIAGIMGAKRTSDLIPLCHPLPLERVNIDIYLEDNTAVVECECRVTHKTGVEMEALAGASIAALTIYDMVKAVSHEVRIEGTTLVSKRGGKRNVGNFAQR